MRFQDALRMRRATLCRLVGAPTFSTELALHRTDCLASHGHLENYEFLRDFAAMHARRPVLPKPLVTGHDLLALGIPEGPALGQWHRRAYEQQLEQPAAPREELLAWLRREMGKKPLDLHDRRD
jgi:poly(A) polymerase